MRSLTNRHDPQVQGFAPDTARLLICRPTNYNDPRTVIFTATVRQ